MFAVQIKRKIAKDKGAAATGYCRPCAMNISSLLFAVFNRFSCCGLRKTLRPLSPLRPALI